MNVLALADGAGGAVIAGTDGPPCSAARRRPAARVRPEDVRLDARRRRRGGRDRDERRVPRRRLDRDLRGGQPDPRGARAGPGHAVARRARPARVEPGRHARVRCPERAPSRRRGRRFDPSLEDEEATHDETHARMAHRGARCSPPSRAARSPRAPRRRWRSRSTTRSRSAGRSPRSSTGCAADFEKENPGIKVKPIYAGTYQETIVKVLTALKSGEPPQTVGAALDRHVHADRRGRDRALRRRGHERRGQGLAQELLPRLHAQQPDRRQDLGHPVPALDHRALLEQGALQGGRPRPEQAARHLGRACSSTRRSSPSATPAATSRQWGVQVPSSGFPYWLFQGFTTPERRAADERGRHRDLLRQAGGGRGAPVLGGSRARKHKVMPTGHHRVGHHAEGLLREARPP